VKTIKLLFFIYIITNCVFAEVDIRISPIRPKQGEKFQVVFKIKDELGDDIEISFSPKNVTVLGRKRRNGNVKTLIVNGRLKTIGEVIYTYDLLMENTTSARLADIKIEIGNKVITHPSVFINATRRNTRPQDFMVIAVPTKVYVYLHEGLSVKYYLYYKKRILNYDITVFPKLNKFLKRLNHEYDKIERAEYDGEIYERKIVYSVRLFPKKSGKIKVDSLKVRIQHSINGRMRTKSISSKSLFLKVSKLPFERLPKDFTGLIGKHTFQFIANKSQYLVNEVIEAKLLVTGPGLLENFELPSIYEHKDLESFEVVREINTGKNNIANKVFKFTYLPRKKLVIAKQKRTFSYFNPETEEYVGVVINIDGINVTGEATTTRSNTKNKNVKNVKKNKVPKMETMTGVNSPIFEYSSLKYNWQKMLNITLGIIVLFFLVFEIRAFLRNTAPKNSLEKIIGEIRKNGINYSKFHHLLKAVDNVDASDKNKSLREVVIDLSLSKDAQNYFIDLLAKCEKENFGADSSEIHYYHQSNYFKELLMAHERRVST